MHSPTMTTSTRRSIPTCGRTFFTAPAAIAAAAALFIAGCGASRQTVTTTMNAADSVLMRLRDSYATTPLLAMNGSMSISGAGVTIWYDAVVRDHDSLKITLTGPFGIPVGALGATPSEFQFFNAQESEVVEGVPDRETFGKLVQIEIDYPEMVAMLRGELPRFPAPGTYTADQRGDIYHYTVSTGTMVENFSIDATDLTVLDYSRSRASGTALNEEFAIVYKEYERLGRRRFPNRASATIAGGQQKISVTVDHVHDEIAGGRSCALVIPNGIPRKRL